MTHRQTVYALLQQLRDYLKGPDGQMPSAAKCMCSASQSLCNSKYLLNAANTFSTYAASRELALGSCSCFHACSTLIAGAMHCCAVFMRA